ncbi:MAG: hypothetical protein NTY09_09945 [bacterium]|nr:hypothetical protein [bacterium]
MTVPTNTESANRESHMYTSPSIHEKLESTNNKILYLIKKVNQLSKSSIGSGTVDDPDRLKNLARKLSKVGLSVEYTDGHGCIKLRADDNRGLDNLKRLNTIFKIEEVESFIENVVS